MRRVEGPAAANVLTLAPGEFSRMPGESLIQHKRRISKVINDFEAGLPMFATVLQSARAKQRSAKKRVDAIRSEQKGSVVKLNIFDRLEIAKNVYREACNRVDEYELELVSVHHTLAELKQHRLSLEAQAMAQKKGPRVPTFKIIG